MDGIQQMILGFKETITRGLQMWLIQVSQAMLKHVSNQ